GGASEILIAQNYDIDDSEKFVADVARYMADRRYIKLEGRPLFIIYRPSIIPEAKKHIEEWRKLFKKIHRIEPLIFMAQFDSTNPSEYDLDGAVEFPPHKIANRLQLIERDIIVFDDAFDKRVYSYPDAVTAALDEPDPK